MPFDCVVFVFVKVVVPVDFGGGGGAVPEDLGGGGGAVPLDGFGGGAVPEDLGGGGTVSTDFEVGVRDTEVLIKTVLLSVGATLDDVSLALRRSSTRKGQIRCGVPSRIPSLVNTSSGSNANPSKQSECGLHGRSLGSRIKIPGYKVGQTNAIHPNRVRRDQQER